MILGIEVDHQRAPLSIRERLSYPEQRIPEALAQLLQGHGLGGEPAIPPPCERNSCTACPHARFSEAAILSTCNRTGIYAVGSCPEPLLRFVASDREAGLLEVRFHAAVYQSREAVEHLFSVAAGLESQVLGEPQILGQVRVALEQALRTGAAGPVLDEFFRRSIEVGKRVRTETELGRHPASLATVAVELAGRLHADLPQTSALLVGTGEMGVLVARLLAKRGVRQISIASRFPERAAVIARSFDGRPLSLDEVPGSLAHADIVVSATDGAGFVVTAPELMKALSVRNGRPLLLIDLGVPRNLDPKIRTLEGVHLQDLDDLKAVTEEGLSRREREIPKARRIVREESETFMLWLKGRRATPLIKALRGRAERVRREQLSWALPKLGALSDRERKVVEALTHRLVNKLLHTPTEELKALAHEAESCEPFLVAKRLFALDASVEGEGTDGASLGGPSAEEPREKHGGGSG